MQKSTPKDTISTELPPRTNTKDKYQPGNAKSTIHFSKKGKKARVIRFSLIRLNISR